MTRTFTLFGVALLLGPWVHAVQAAVPAQANDRQAQFTQESDPVRRAKLMVKLSREDFHQIRQFLSAQKNDDALKVLQQIRDDAQTCEKGLDAREKNAEAHPAGFKDLQIAMRQSLRSLDDLMAGLTSDEQPPFQALRADLDRVNRQLIRQLFPHQPQAEDDSDQQP